MQKPRIQIRPRRRPPLNFISLGGCGEIGMNLTLYGFESKWIAIDCGMLIRQDLPDTPLQIPDIDALNIHDIAPQALILTHGHEDHLGAVTWIWPHWGCPIWASPLAASLLRQKFIDKGLATESIQVFTPGHTVQLDPFVLDTLPVPHSIPESCALLITTSAHRILHTGDWKLDASPLIGKPIDQHAFSTLGPVDLLVGDSTNATQDGHSRSESEVAEALEEQLRHCQGRVVVSCFASNLARILAIGRAAERNGRRIALLGRAMTRMLQIARSLGYADNFPPIVPLHDMGYLPKEEVLLIATGSQGEPRAALSRLAHNSHGEIELQPGDSVIFSSKAIPGNEAAIERLQNAFRCMGVGVFTEKQRPGLHASGHPCREELETLYRWVRPKCLLPVHGEVPHQTAHQQLAQTLGILAPHIPRNGEWLQWDGHDIHVKATLPLTTHLIGSRQPYSSYMRSTPQSYQKDLTLILPVTWIDGSWQRVGRLIVDSDTAHYIDDTALRDWLDTTLATSNVTTTHELGSHLAVLTRQWLYEATRIACHVKVDVIETCS